MTLPSDQPPDIDPIIELERIRVRLTPPKLRGRPRDSDSYASAESFRVTTWAVMLSFILAGLAAAGAGLRGYNPLVSFIGTFVGVFLLFTLFARILPNRAGDAGASLYAPTGSSTPAPREYSLAQSLAVRGQFDAAIATYRDDAQEHPEDPEPCIRIARILRDSLHKDDEAVQWFRKARAAAKISESQDMMVGREIAELYMYKLNEPARATPELARLAETYPDAPAGVWAREKLREIKAEMRSGS